MDDLSGTVIGIFELNQRLSSGGTASVYAATLIDREINPHRYGKQVALKISHAGHFNSALFEAWLKTEIDLLSRLWHPGIVRVYPIDHVFAGQYLGRAPEVDPESAPWYFCMELLTQRTLRDLIYDPQSIVFDMPWRMELLYQLLITVDYLHLQRLAHRDLKPENVLFRRPPMPGAQPQPVLIDFGLGAGHHGIAGELRASALTVSHAAPERLHNVVAQNDGDLRTQAWTFDYQAADVYSLGVLAYELFNGRYLFEAVDRSTREEDIVSLVLNHTPDPMNSDVPRDLEAMVLNMLEPNPHERPTTQQVIRWLEKRGELMPPRV